MYRKHFTKIMYHRAIVIYVISLFINGTIEFLRPNLPVAYHLVNLFIGFCAFWFPMCAYLLAYRQNWSRHKLFWLAIILSILDMAMLYLMLVGCNAIFKVKLGG